MDKKIKKKKSETMTKGRKKGIYIYIKTWNANKT